MIGDGSDHHGREGTTFVEGSDLVRDDRDPWDPQPGETSVQYQAFLIYRDLPKHARSMKRAILVRAKERDPSLDLDDPDVSARIVNAGHRTWAEWSRLNHWVDRVAAYDIYQMELIAYETRQRIVDMRSRHASIAQGFIAKAVEKLSSLDGTAITPRDMVAMFELGVRVERMARGEAADAIAVIPQGSGSDRESLTVESLEAVLSALHEAGVYTAVVDGEPEAEPETTP